jgi:antitoxin component YwqK of YwqJK toxin-antitoxin module
LAVTQNKNSARLNDLILLDMRRFILLITLIILGFNINGQSINISELTSKDSILYYKDKIYNGNINELYTNRKIWHLGFVKNGRLDSTFTTFDKNGKIIEIARFKDNVLINRTVYINTLTTKKIVTLTNDVEDGLYVEYYSNGLPMDSGYYSMGKPVGNWTYWDKKGRKTLEIFNHKDYIEHKIYDYKKDSISNRYEYFDLNGKKIKK